VITRRMKLFLLLCSVDLQVNFPQIFVVSTYT